MENVRRAQGCGSGLIFRECTGSEWGESQNGTSNYTLSMLAVNEAISDVNSVICDKGVTSADVSDKGDTSMVSRLQNEVILVHQSQLDVGNPHPLQEQNQVQLPFVAHSHLVSATVVSREMSLRDPRQHQHYFSCKSLFVQKAIWGWGPIPSIEENVLCAKLELHTDGSAILSPTWLHHPVAAGWGCLLFAVLQDSTKRFLGAAWGPVASEQSSGYSLCKVRPTIPVAELQAIVMALRLL